MRNSEPAPDAWPSIPASAKMAPIALRTASPLLLMRSTSPWSNAFSVSMPATMDTGLALKVPVWGTAGLPLRWSNTPMMSVRPATAPTGKPPPISLPSVVMSGTMP